HHRILLRHPGARQLYHRCDPGTGFLEECVSALADSGQVRGPWSRAQLDAAIVRYRDHVGDDRAECAYDFVNWLVTRTVNGTDVE
ncbi:MAG: hypothetical protein R6W79_10885, partial [Acidimicrobiia bacterium]